MSHYPYGGRGYSSLSSSFNERAAPRMSDGMSDRRYHHRVVPVQQAGAPHYAQFSALYPMQAHSDNPNSFQYRPEDGVIDVGGQQLSGGQAVVIPVVHLGSNRETLSPMETYSTSTNHSSPFYDSRSVASPTGSLKRTPITRKVTATNAGGVEAEVDALTNVLMRSMETRPNMKPTSSLMGHESGTSSPGGSIRRGVGSIQGQVASPTSGLTNSRLTRFQQQQNSGSPVGSLNGGQGSPLAATLATTGSTGSPRTSSPTSSVSSNVGDPFLQNNCFRCRRALIPPEGTTLGPVAPPVATLTGALAVRLHATCFTCYLCKTPLTPNAYYHSLHRLLCPTCVRDGAVESCANCHRPIGERTVRALGLPYHPGCFTCTVCNARLDSKPFTVDVLGRPLCLDDFHRRYAPRCAVCNRPIAPEQGSQEARRVVAGNSNYHLSCYGVNAALQQSNATTPTPTAIATS